MFERMQLTLGLALLAGVAPVYAQHIQPSAATSATSPATAAEAIARGQTDGRLAARDVRTRGWLWGGVGAGLFGGLLASGVVWAAAGNSDVSVPIEKRVAMSGEPLAYQQSFESGYTSRVKSQRRKAALTGGLVGTAVGTIAFLAFMGAWE